MIKRDSYMKRIRPFIGTDLVKVLTGIRRSGKSVMLELIKQEKLILSVIDSPPCGSICDAGIFAGVSDAVLYVIRQDSITSKSIRIGINNLLSLGSYGYKIGRAHV